MKQGEMIAGINKRWSALSSSTNLERLEKRASDFTVKFGPSFRSIRQISGTHCG
jgi:hypothetical protein